MLATDGVLLLLQQTKNIAHACGEIETTGVLTLINIQQNFELHLSTFWFSVVIDYRERIPYP